MRITCPHRRRRAVVVVIAIATAIVPCSAFPAAAVEAEVSAYRPPVEAVLTDTFRPPAAPYGAGNRGVEYATTADQPVAAAADGEVVFAGRIGTSSHVTVLHDDGIRTSYSFLATTNVRRGQRVTQGDQLGITGATPLHFGARAGEAYVDPLVLLGQGPSSDETRRAWLVDDPDPTKPLTEAQERQLIVDAIRGLLAQATNAASGLADHTAQAIERKIELLQVLADDARDLGLPMPVHLAVAAARWRHEQQRCTPGDAPVPTEQARQRRIVILVGGLGSATGNAAVLDVDTTTLGYAPDDVHQFNYRDDGKAYGPEDTQGDIGEQGRRLALDIAGLQGQNPGTPVDVIAHSQGGLVARSAITTHRANPATLVTLGTPHQGTDIATAGVGVDATATGNLFLDAATVATRPKTSLDLNSTSILQMAETSDFITDLPEQGWDPAVTHVVSVAARADPVVPNHQSRLANAYSTVVTPNGTSTPKDHSALPGSPEATAEIARALDRQPPTCRALEDTLLDTLAGRSISNTQDTIGAALTAGALYADVRTGPAKALVTTR